MVLFQYFTVVINSCFKASMPQDLNSLLPFFSKSYLQPQNCDRQAYVLFRRRLLKWQNHGKAGSPRLGSCAEGYGRRARRATRVWLAPAVALLTFEMEHVGVCGYLAQRLRKFPFLFPWLQFRVTA